MDVGFGRSVIHSSTRFDADRDVARYRPRDRPRVRRGGGPGVHRSAARVRRRARARGEASRDDIRVIIVIIAIIAIIAIARAMVRWPAPEPFRRRRPPHVVAAVLRQRPSRPRVGRRGTGGGVSVRRRRGPGADGARRRGRRRTLRRRDVSGVAKKGVVFALEHRFYGASQPTGDLSMSSLRYLSSQQALEDVAAFFGAREGAIWSAKESSGRVRGVVSGHAGGVGAN